MWGKVEPTVTSKLPVGGTITSTPRRNWDVPPPARHKWARMNAQADVFVFVVEPRIVRTSGVLGGKPRIADHRISVQDVVIWHERLGLSAEQIARKYDLPPDDVQAALDYYADHRDEIEASIRAGEAVVSELRQRYPSKLKA